MLEEHVADYASQFEAYDEDTNTFAKKMAIDPVTASREEEKKVLDDFWRFMKGADPGEHTSDDKH